MAHSPVPTLRYSVKRRAKKPGVGKPYTYWYARNRLQQTVFGHADLERITSEIRAKGVWYKIEYHWPKGKYAVVRRTARNGKWVYFLAVGPTGVTMTARQFNLMKVKYDKAGVWYDPVYFYPPTGNEGYPNATHISQHFTRAEFACKDTARTPVPQSLMPNAIRLAWSLELMRALYRGPMPLLSVYRTKAHNYNVKGASNSQHLYATAADHVIANSAQRRLKIAAALKCPEIKGMGVYPGGGLHTDVRKVLKRVTWSSY